MSSSNCCFLTCTQVSQEAGQVVWYAHLFQNFPQFIVIHTVKGSGIVNKAEIDIFLELSCFFHDPSDAGNLISGSSAFSKTSLYIWKFTVHVLLKPGLENFKYYFASMWDKYNRAVVWAFFGIAFLWDMNEKFANFKQSSRGIFPTSPWPEVVMAIKQRSVVFWAEKSRWLHLQCFCGCKNHKRWGRGHCSWNNWIKVQRALLLIWGT